MHVISLAMVALMSFLPGYLLVCNLPRSIRDSVVDDDSLPAVALAFSVILIAVIQFITFLTGGPPLWVNLAIYSLITWTLFMRVKVFKLGLSPRPTATWFAFLLLLLFLLLMLMLLPSYQTGITLDWRMYYPNSGVYLYRPPLEALKSRELEYLINRTPLLSLFATFFTSIIGQTYGGFQVACMFVNALIFWPVYLVTRQLFGRRAVITALLLLPLAPAMVRVISVPEPKCLGTFFVLMAAYFYLLTRDRRQHEHAGPRYALVGLFAAAAYMTHQSMLFYLIWIYVDYVYVYLRRHRHRRFDWRLPLWTAAAGMVVIMPWYGWAVSATGIDRVLAPTSSIDEGGKFTVVSYVQTRVQMILYSLFVPRDLAGLIAEGYKPWPAGFSRIELVDHIRFGGHLVLRYYYQTFLGGMTTVIGLCVLVLGWLMRPRQFDRIPRRPLFLWMGFGGLVCFVVHQMVDYWGHATNLSSPLFVVVFCYAGYILGRLPTAVRRIVLGVAMIEFIGVRIVILVMTHHLPHPPIAGIVYQASADWVESPGRAAFLIFLIVVYGGYISIVRHVRSIDGKF